MDAHVTNHAELIGWYRLDWPSPLTITRVELFDRLRYQYTLQHTTRNLAAWHVWLTAVVPKGRREILSALRCSSLERLSATFRETGAICNESSITR
jgi:hypothetical protein